MKVYWKARNFLFPISSLYRRVAASVAGIFDDVIDSRVLEGQWSSGYQHPRK
jgi:hypothetical protein